MEQREQSQDRDSGLSYAESRQRKAIANIDTEKNFMSLFTAINRMAENRRQAESKVKLASTLPRRELTNEREESEACFNYPERGGRRRSQRGNAKRKYDMPMAA